LFETESPGVNEAKVKRGRSKSASFCSSVRSSACSSPSATGLGFGTGTDVPVATLWIRHECTTFSCLPKRLDRGYTNRVTN
jgi:hypothetical protein